MDLFKAAQKHNREPRKHTQHRQQLQEEHRKVNTALHYAALRTLEPTNDHHGWNCGLSMGHTNHLLQLPTAKLLFAVLMK